MAGIAAGFALAPPVAISRSVRTAASASSPARFPVRPWPWAQRCAARRIVAAARYSYGFDDDEWEEEEGDEFEGGDERSENEYDEALDINRIESSTVRMLDEDKRMVGVVSLTKALQIADEKDLLLVILSVDGDPPVVRLIKEKEYRKYKYEQRKKKRDQQKKSVANRMGLKELKMGYNIDIHDYSVRLKSARKFLKEGDKVKAIVNLKGRENEYRNTAIELIRRFQNDVGELAIEEARNFNEKNIYMVLAPNKVLRQKEQARLKKMEAVTEEQMQGNDEPATEVPQVFDGAS